MSRALWAATLLIPLVAYGQAAYQRQEGEFSLTRGLAGDQVRADVSVDTTGGYIVWQDSHSDGDGSGITARVINNYLSPDTRVTFQVNRITAGNQEKPRVARLTSGGTCFVWQGGPLGSQDVFARFMNVPRGAISVETDILVNSHQQGEQSSAAVAALQGGSSVVVWSSFGQDGSMQGIYGQRFNVSGLKAGSEFSVNQFTLFNQRDPAVAGLDNGNFIVVWVSEQQRIENSVDIYGRLFSSEGQPLGDEFLVSHGTNVCANPSVARATGGGFVVGWSERDVLNLENGWDISARIFAADGTAVSGVVRVNHVLSGHQFAPRVSSLGNDSLFIWTSEGQDGAREGIYGRFLRAAEYLTAEFRVNATTVSQQIHPAVSSDGAGRFLAVWSSFTGLQNSFEVIGQRIGNTDSLAQPEPPFVAALDSYRLSVTWPEAAGYTNVAHYKLYVDGSATGISLNQTRYVLDGVQPGSTHTFQLGIVLSDGRTSPLSATASGKTWGRDDNFDGLPDDWQTTYWGSDKGLWPAASADSDGDGARNVDEFLAGTHPDNADSVLRMSMIETNQGYRLTWNTVAGSLYQVQYSIDFSAWTNLGDVRFASGTVDSIPIGELNQIKYYRVIRVR